MHTENIPLDETDCFSSLFIDYISRKPELESFHCGFPSIDNFQSAIDNRNFNADHRPVLAKTLLEQYEGTHTSQAVLSNIHLLKEGNTFTITTGHQLNIFTGPLYFIYKIVTVINACKSLKESYPDYNFVPVYWMASEDHDFDEISHFYLGGKKYQWETDQTGAVGRFKLDGIKDILDQLPKGADFFREAYDAESLADAGRNYVNYLFGEEGLVVIDADDRTLKKLFAPVMEDDMFGHSSQKASEKDTAALEELGYKSQITAREINFFYLDDGIRERIEKAEKGYRVVDTDISFSDEEIRSLISNTPEKLSPNVILRPLYQETILPNLAYVGGPSEAVYWLQLKSVFAHFDTAFPLLMPRNFALVIPENEGNKWKKTGLDYKDLFLDRHSAFTKWVQANSSKDLSYAGEVAELKTLYQKLADKASAVDPTLKQHLEALAKTAENKLEKAGKKLVRAEKRNHSEKQEQIDSVKDYLFPGGSLQERRDNFMNFYLEDSQFVQRLLDTFDAFEFSMYLIFEST